MAKELKFWNGRDQRNYRGSLAVAAYSRQDASKAILEAMGNKDADKSQVKQMNRELKEYFHDCWGTRMHEHVPNPERGVWVYTYSALDPIERLL